MHAYVRRRRYSKPVQRQTLSIRLDAGAPVNSKLTLEMSVHYENLFVAHGCMFRLRWQLPVSCDQYHGKQDRLPISRTGARTVGPGGFSLAFAVGLNPVAMVTFPAPATSNAAGGFPALRFPACFMSRFMGPIVLGTLSTTTVDEPDSH